MPIPTCQPLAPTQLVITSSIQVYDRWLMEVARYHRDLRNCRFLYLWSVDQLRGRRRENGCDILLLEDWVMSPLFAREDVVIALNQDFPGWEMQFHHPLPWLHQDRRTETGIEIRHEMIRPTSHREPPSAYLNGVLVGYGELVEEISEGYGHTTTGLRVQGEIIVPPDRLDAARRVLWTAPSKSSIVRFTGRLRSRSSNILHGANDTPVALTYIWWERWETSKEPEYGLRVGIRKASESIPQTLCDRCSYYLRGTPPICNAFHPVNNVEECSDFRID